MIRINLPFHANGQAKGKWIETMSAPAVSLQSAAHVVQLALAPVFLLSGIGALLSVFAARLGRVADQAVALAMGDEQARDLESRPLRRRTRALECAVVLAALAGALTCGTVLALFLEQVGGAGASNLLFLLFGGAIVLTMGALLAYVVEMLLAARGVHRLVGKGEGGGGDARRTNRPGRGRLNSETYRPVARDQVHDARHLQ